MKKILFFLSISIMANLLEAQDFSFGGFFPVWSQTGRISDKLNYNFFIATTVDAFKETESGVEYPAADLNLCIQSSIIYVIDANWNVAASYTIKQSF